MLTFANNSVEKTSLGVKPAQNFYTKRYLLYTIHNWRET